MLLWALLGLFEDLASFKIIFKNLLFNTALPGASSYQEKYYLAATSTWPKKE